MKAANISDPRNLTDEQIEGLVALAPEEVVQDDDEPYDVRDHAAVDAYFAKCVITRPGEHHLIPQLVRKLAVKP
ncbi:hypothetical protein ACLB1G_17075 [Oxalobacteraceae bacterium A2-2]